MDNISEEFANEIQKNTNHEFDIVVVTDIEADISHFQELRELMQGIYAAKLKGCEIIELSKNNGVLSIEKDDEIKVL